MAATYSDSKFSFDRSPDWGYRCGIGERSEARCLACDSRMSESLRLAAPRHGTPPSFSTFSTFAPSGFEAPKGPKDHNLLEIQTVSAGDAVLFQV
jgi:hypothetical protein